MRIQHNIMAMSAYRNYNNNTSALSKNLEKLSSGYKINRAGDDAAGLAISEKMRAQITGLSAAQKNVKDGISLVKTAEGAMQEIQDMLNRMDYLATQSANGTYQDEVDREALQKEVDQLNSEINRIADSANFNGIKLLDGSWDTDAAANAQKAVDAAQKKLDDLTFETKYADVDVKSLLLSEAPNPVPGTNTVLQVNGADPTKPGFSVELDGYSYGVKTAGTDQITLTIGGVTVDSNKATNAEVLDAAAIAQLFDGKTFTSTSFKDNGGNDLVFKITADGTTLNFTPTATAGDIINTNLDVSIAGTETSTKTIDATAAVYEYTMTGGVQAQVNGKKIDGVDITWKSDIDDTMADFVTAYNAAGKDYTASYAGSTLTLTAKKEGKPATDVVTDITDLKGDGTVNLSTTTVKAGTGTDATFTGSKGSLNVGTVNVRINTKGSDDRLANTEVNLTDYFKKDGAQITLGDTTFTVAAGKNSDYKNAKNVIDLTDYETAADVDVEVAASRLTEKAAEVGNGIFSIGNDKAHAGYISLQQLSTAKDKNMETMDNLLKYISVKAPDADATAAAKEAAEAPLKEALQKAKERLDKVTNEGEGGKTLNLQIGDTADSFNKLGVKIGSMKTEAMGIEGLNISTSDSAAKAIDTIKNAINYVSSVRGDLGAYQNRLEHTGNNLSVMAENIQDAESTIRDTDVAEEMMGYVKNNILVQSAQAMLAQANQVPQGVLQLLG